MLCSSYFFSVRISVTLDSVMCSNSLPPLLPLPLPHPSLLFCWFSFLPKPFLHLRFLKPLKFFSLGVSLGSCHFDEARTHGMVVIFFCVCPDEGICSWGRASTERTSCSLWLATIIFYLITQHLDCLRPKGNMMQILVSGTT